MEKRKPPKIQAGPLDPETGRGASKSSAGGSCVLVSRPGIIPARAVSDAAATQIASLPEGARWTSIVQSDRSLAVIRVV
jgi:hypothetical protein